MKTTAKDFFLYLGFIIGLYVSAISFLVLVFTIINKVLPLSGEYIGSFDGSIRSAIAALIIFFPAFIYVSYLINNELKTNPDKKDIWVRRWGIFLTLFIAGLTIAIDLVILIYRFLGAEDLSARFFLKVFFVLALAITIFRSTLYDLKRTAFEYTKNMKMCLGIISTVVVIAIIYGVVLIGSPTEQRARNLDERRVSDLMSIQTQILYTHWTNKGDVPEKLEDLDDSLIGYFVPTDPETGDSYEYKRISKNSFELCATFVTESKTTSEARPTKMYINGIANENWQHSAERTCFTRTIDEELYPVSPARKSL